MEDLQYLEVVAEQMATSLLRDLLPQGAGAVPQAKSPPTAKAEAAPKPEPKPEAAKPEPKAEAAKPEPKPGLPSQSPRQSPSQSPRQKVEEPM